MTEEKKELKMADLIIETGEFDILPHIRIEEYYDSFSIIVAGKSFQFDQEDPHEKLVDVFKEVLKYFEEGDETPIEYELVY